MSVESSHEFSVLGSRPQTLRKYYSSLTEIVNNLLRMEELLSGGAPVGTLAFLVGEDQPVMLLPRCLGFEGPKQGDY